MTASELCRKLDVPSSRLMKAIKAGTIEPTFEAAGGRVRLFGSENLNEYRKALGLPAKTA